MPAFRANPGYFTWSAPKPYSGGSFRPHGQLGRRGPYQNPREWSSTDTLSARLVVGFNVGEHDAWSMDDLIPIVEEVRRRQVGDPSSTFLYQKGVYQHRDGSGRTVHEDGAQVIIIDPSGIDRELFEEQMVELAEIIAARLAQETVIVDIQKNGISQLTIGVKP
jgi:hypothetical protein